jgi:hypothetical protein
LCLADLPSRNLPPKLRFEETKPLAPYGYPQVVNQRIFETFVIAISDELPELRLDLLNLLPG